MARRMALCIALAASLFAGCGRRDVTAPTAASRAGGAQPAAVSAISVSRAELNSGALRVEGGGATPNATVTIDGGAASGRADGAGAFRIEKSPFSSSTCRITVSDGTSSVQASLSGCAASAPPPSPVAAPTALAPANGAQLLVPLTISWSAVSDPSGIIAYNWQVSTSSTFSPVILLDSTMGPTQALVSGLPNGSYFWRVQAVTGALVQGAWSATSNFTVTGVGPGEPGSPTLNPPRGGTLFHPRETITFTWSPVAGAASYVFDASLDPSFPVLTKVHINNIPNTSYTLAFADQGSWLARVYAVDANGVAGVPSNTDAFSVLYTNTLPPPPTPLAPLSGVNVTLPVRLSWTEVPNPQDGGYEVQISGSSTFASIEDDIPIITPPFRDVISLTAGTKFWRVRSFQGDASPTTAAVTAWSASGSFTIPSAPPAVTGITLTRSAPFSGEVEDGTVQLAAAAPAGGAVVTLTSSVPGAAPAPATVTVPAGFAVAPFSFQTGQVTVAMPVTLTATIGSSATSVPLTVQPPSLNHLFVPSTITGGTTVGEIVYLNGLAPASGAVVSLTSNSAAVTPPATATIAAGQSTVSVLVATSPVTTTTLVTLTASWNGGSVQTQLTLTPSQPPATITLSPTTTTGNSGSSGTVTIGSPASMDLQLALVSSNTAVATTNSFVTIPAGTMAGGFLVFTQPPAAPTTVTISVSGAGVTKSASLTVNPFPSAPLPAPTLLAPAVDARFAAGQTVAFDWTDVASAASYTIQVSASSTFTTTVINQRVTPSQFATATLPVTTLFWRARAHDSAGNPGTWAAARSFRVK